MKILPHVSRYKIAKAAVITRHKGRQIIDKAASVPIPNGNNSYADKIISVIMFATSLSPRFNSKMAKMVAPNEVEPVIGTLARRKPSSKRVYKYVPKTSEKVKLMAKGPVPNVTKLNNKFNSLLLDNDKKKNPLNNKVPIFVQSGRKHGVDPTLLMAISMVESGRGTSQAAKLKHNVGGIMNSNGKLKTFSNVNLCIDQMAETLAYHHRENKINTVKELAYAGKYCAKSEAPLWIKNVMHFFNELQNEIA